MAHDALAGSTGEHVRASVTPDDRPNLELCGYRLLPFLYAAQIWQDVKYPGE